MTDLLVAHSWIHLLYT